MSDPENFLSRWSRRKQEVARDEDARNDEAADPKQVAGVPAPEAEVEKHAEVTENAEAAEPAFDLSKLPSIESITADTDIRPFLAAGVPGSLRQAALRRAWVADPKIRDFIEMAENQWDFTAGGNAPGFDFSAPAGDVKRMVAELLGERQPEDVREREPATEVGVLQPDPVNQFGVTEREAEQPQDPEHVAPNNNLRLGEAPGTKDETSRDVASQNNDAPQKEPLKISRRSHGGAMPK